MKEEGIYGMGEEENERRKERTKGGIYGLGEEGNGGLERQEGRRDIRYGMGEEGRDGRKDERGKDIWIKGTRESRRRG